VSFVVHVDMGWKTIGKCWKCPRKLFMPWFNFD
jgi:hypothetical protein